MCTIVALFGYASTAPPVSRGEQLRMRDSMANRGPGGSGEWLNANGGVALDHPRLAIIDLSPGGAQRIEYGTSVEDAYLLRRALYMPWELPKVLDPDLVRQGWTSLRPLLSFRESIAGIRSSRAQVAILEMSWYMRNQLLRDTDWAAMAHSLEVRTPLVDAVLLRHIAQLLLSVPPPNKLDMARATPVGRLESVLTRRKSGFTVPVREWLFEGAAAGAADHGFRGWANYVFRRHVPAA